MHVVVVLSNNDFRSPVLGRVGVRGGRPHGRLCERVRLLSLERERVSYSMPTCCKQVGSPDT